MAHQMVAAPSCSLDEIDLNALKVSPDELRNIAAAKCYVVAVFWCSRLCLFAEIQRVRCGLDGWWWWPGNVSPTVSTYLHSKSWVNTCESPLRIGQYYQSDWIAAITDKENKRASEIPLASNLITEVVSYNTSGRTRPGHYSPAINQVESVTSTFIVTT